MLTHYFQCQFPVFCVAICQFFFPIHIQAKASSLEELEKCVHEDVQKLDLPKAWIRAKSSCCDILDVAVIGGGMAGMTTGFALAKEGITNIAIFDENPNGLEGPWRKYARMHTLRSSKSLQGPALGVPSLTFRSWYEACHGETAWESLGFISTQDWSKYLSWYGKVLNLPIVNQMTLQSIAPQPKGFTLTFERSGGIVTVNARKVILATGREGFGGLETPDFISQLPKKYWAHTGEMIEETVFQQKRVVVIGAGASAFDAAGVSLENGAQQVTILVRRASLPMVNKFSKFAFPGIVQGFYSLSDELRCQFLVEAFENGIPPAEGAVERIKEYKNLAINYQTNIEEVYWNGKEIVLRTSRGEVGCDFVVLGTGFAVDGNMRAELQPFMDDIMLWEEHVPKDVLARMPKIGNFPYLGPHFQFLEKEKGAAPYLKHLYCFNYGAYLSHGLLSGDIPGISSGASRLAMGIGADFFTEEVDIYQQVMRNYSIPLFDIEEYPFLLQ